MENNEIVSIPFVAHESDMNRMERINKRIITIAIIELIVILSMFIGIMVYFCLPSEEIVEEYDSKTQEVIDAENSEIHQNIGG